ncbi:MULTISPECIES: SRPBCC family protein [unclassified Streptomyces]|uniref:SRPBCC family protein n=1 Tax=unclassified Streptomyces TaxID=2593676 RepID=UPI003D9268E3
MIVDASVEAVWRVVADITRTSEWSHECHRITWLRGATTAAPGARFRGHNRSGRLRWSRDCEIVAVEAPHRITWRTIATTVFPDSTDWTIELEPVGTRTRVVQTYQMRDTPRWFRWIAGVMVPMHLDRGDALADDLRRIGTIAARDAEGAAARQ